MPKLRTTILPAFTADINGHLPLNTNDLTPNLQDGYQDLIINMFYLDWLLVGFTCSKFGKLMVKNLPCYIIVAFSGYVVFYHNKHPIEYRFREFLLI